MNSFKTVSTAISLLKDSEIDGIATETAVFKHSFATRARTLRFKLLARLSRLRSRFRGRDRHIIEPFESALTKRLKIRIADAHTELDRQRSRRQTS